MAAIQRCTRLLGALALIVALMAGWGISPAVAQDGTGSLTIALVDDLGASLAGGCFDVTDAAGALQSLCDDDGDGLVAVEGLPPGDATVTQTSGPDGYSLAGSQAVTVVAGDSARVDMVGALIPVPTETVEAPTPEPTAAATETGTPVETETATVEPEGTPEPEPTIEPTPTVTASPEDKAEVGLAANKQSSFVHIRLYVSTGSSIAGPYDEVLPGSAVNLDRWLMVVAEINRENPTPVPTGSVNFEFFRTADCQGGFLLNETANLDANANAQPTQKVYIGQPGIYNVRAAYSGDENYHQASNACGDASVYNGGSVARPDHDLFVVDASGAPVTSLLLGDLLRFRSVIDSIHPNPSNEYGQVTFFVYLGPDCTGLSSNVASTPVMGANPPVQTVETSPGRANIPGVLYLRAYYSGTTDLVNLPRWSNCISFTVTSPLVLTVPSIVGVGASVSGQVTWIASEGGAAQLIYAVYSGSDCSGIALTSRGPYEYETSTPHQSEAIPFPTAGTYSWIAALSINGEVVLTSNCATMVVSAPQLSAAKSATDTDLESDESFRYKVSVRNDGDGAAINLRITDTLPSGYTWTVWGHSGQLSCGAIGTDRVLTCTAPSLAADTSYEVDVTGTPDGTRCGAFSNTATVSADNHATVTTNTVNSVVHCSDLVIAKTAVDTTVTAGHVVSFDITATNGGDTAVNGVVVLDSLSSAIPGLTWMIQSSMSSPGCAITSGELRCDWGTLTPETAKTVRVRATATGSVCGAWTNTATGTATNEDSTRLTNNSASAQVTVQCPDIAITKTPVEALVPGGSSIGFTIRVENVGDALARDATVDDLLPPGYTWSEDHPNCEIAVGRLGCDLGNMQPGESITMVLTAASSADACGPVSNTATVQIENEPSGRGANNSSTAIVTLTCPDLAVIKEPTAPSVSAGAIAEFRITITNVGNVDATGVHLMDGLPYGIEWSTQTAGCVVLGGALGCQIGTIPIGSSVVVIVRGTTTSSSCGPQGSYVFAWAENERAAQILNNITYGEFTVRCS
jgi:uncharacterized repeat protein (TIGR01451 family)